MVIHLWSMAQNNNERIRRCCISKNEGFDGHIIMCLFNFDCICGSVCLFIIELFFFCQSIHFSIYVEFLTIIIKSNFKLNLILKFLFQVYSNFNL